MKRVKLSQNKRLNILHNIELDVEHVRKTFVPIANVNLTMLDKLVKKLLNLKKLASVDFVNQKFEVLPQT
jgi:hypothetical protein